MKIVDEKGVPHAASFLVEPFEGAVSVALHSVTGSAARDYPVALRLLLSRLAAVEAGVIDAFVDSGHTRALGLTRRESRLVLRGGRTYPLPLAREEDLDELRRAFGAAQGPIGRPAGAEDRRSKFYEHPHNLPARVANQSELRKKLMLAASQLSGNLVRYVFRGVWPSEQVFRGPVA